MPETPWVIDLDTISPEDLYDEIHEALDAGVDVLFNRGRKPAGLLSPATAGYRSVV